MKTTTLLIALFAAVLPAAHAADVGQHPAVFAPRSLPGIDASTFIPGHPAGGAPGKADRAAKAGAVAGKPAQTPAATQVSAAPEAVAAVTRHQ